MIPELKIMDFLRRYFADGECKTTSQLTDVLHQQFGLNEGQAVRRVMRLHSLGEIRKVKRGIFQRVAVTEPDELLYDVFVKMRDVVDLSLVAKIDVTDFSESYQPAVCELVYIMAKINDVIERLDSERGSV